MHPAPSTLHCSGRPWWTPATSLGPVLLISRGELLLTPLWSFLQSLGFYDTAWVTPAIIDVWSMFGENALGAVSGVNTEQVPHKSGFPQGVQRSLFKCRGLVLSTNLARVERWSLGKSTLKQTHPLDYLTEWDWANHQVASWHDRPCTLSNLSTYHAAEVQFIGMVG